MNKVYVIAPIIDATEVASANPIYPIFPIKTKSRITFKTPVRVFTIKTVFVLRIAKYALFKTNIKTIPRRPIEYIFQAMAVIIVALKLNSPRSKMIFTTKSPIAKIPNVMGKNITVIRLRA